MIFPGPTASAKKGNLSTAPALSMRCGGEKDPATLLTYHKSPLSVAYMICSLSLLSSAAQGKTDLVEDRVTFWGPASQSTVPGGAVSAGAAASSIPSSIKGIRPNSMIRFKRRSGVY